MKQKEILFVCRLHLKVKSNLAWAGPGAALDRPDLTAGEIKYITRTDHSEALMVRGTGYDVVQLDQPRASLSSSADTHRTVLSNS